MALVPPSSKYGNAAIVLGSGAVGYAHTGDTLETLVASVAIPANTIGLGQLEIWSYWTWPNNGNNKIVRIRFGAANDLTGTIVLTTTGTTSLGMQVPTILGNRTAASQIGFPSGNSGGTGVTSSAPATPAIDTTAQTYVVFSVQNASSGDTSQLERYSVVLLPPV